MIKWIQRAFRAFIKRNTQNPESTEFPFGQSVQPSYEPWRIQDGNTYAQPAVIPQHIAEMRNSDNPAERDAFNKYITEALEPFRTQFATPYAQGAPFSELGFTTVLLPLMEWSWSARRYVLEQCHLAWERNPLAKGAVRYNRLFSVQNGHAMTYHNDKVEDILEAFRSDPRNNVKELDKMAVETLNIDGEIFIRFFVGGGENGGESGEVVITPLRPWYIQWIKANPQNFRDIESYRYSGTVSDGSGLNTETYNEDIPADQIHHVAVNRLIYEQRGRPELFSILPYLQGHKRWLEDRARQNAFRGAVYDVSLKNATPGQVAARAAAYKKPMMAGTVNIHNDNETFQVLEQLVGASDAAEDGRQIKLQAAVGMNLPEYMLADGSNANLASATAQQLPAIKSFAEWKDIMIDQFWKPIFNRVIDENIAAGLLPEQVPMTRSDGKPVIDEETGEPEFIDVHDAYEVSYSSDENIDQLNAVQAILAAVNAGLMSEQTATGEMPWGLEYDIEQERIGVENQKSMNDMLSGKTPIPPGINPATGQPGMPQMPDDNSINNEEDDKETEDDKTGSE
jgi:hypothetical protein